MVNEVSSIIQSMENRMTFNEAIAIVLERQVGVLARRDIYKKNIKVIKPDIYGQGESELLRLTIRDFTYLILEYLLEHSYAVALTKDALVEFFRAFVHEKKNPWGMSETIITQLADDIIRDVLRNEGKVFEYYDEPFTNPTKVEQVVLIKTETVRQEGVEVVTYRLTDEGFQFLYRKKEVDLYFEIDILTMKLKEAVKKGNFGDALQTARDIESVLGYYQYTKIPTFIEELNERLDQLHEEKRRLCDEIDSKLRNALQHVKHVQLMVGDKRQLSMKESLEGKTLNENKKYLENKEKLLQLEGKLKRLLQLIGMVFSSLQRLNDEYERLLDLYEVKTSYEFIDIEADLYPRLVDESLENVTTLLSAWFAIFQTEKEKTTYTLERLIRSKRRRRSSVKSETTVFDEEVNEEWLETVDEEAAASERLAFQVELIKDLILFSSEQEHVYLSDYLEFLSQHDLERYLDYLSLEGTGWFYHTLLYVLYGKSFYLPIDMKREEELKKTVGFEQELVEAMVHHPDLVGYKGSYLSVELVHETDQAPLQINESFSNFKLTLTEPTW